MSSSTPGKETITSKATQQLSRQEFYELVWMRPIQQLASEFGLSDVGLAKICKRFAIPRPGRGYWAQVRAGAKLKRTRLPRPPKGTPSVVTFYRVSAPGERAGNVAHVQLGDGAEAPHAVALWAASRIGAAETDLSGRLLIGSERGSTLCVLPATVERALQLLSTVAHALEARGLLVHVGPKWDHAPEALSVLVDGRLPISIDEHLEQGPAGDVARAVGRLCLRVHFLPYRSGTRSWRDRGRRRVEDHVARAVVFIEEAATVARQIEEEREREEREWLRTERRRLRPKRLRWYGRLLAGYLNHQLREWQRAREIREFLADYERRLPLVARTARAEGWRDAAAAYADKLDPLTRVAWMAKPLRPSDLALERLFAKYNPDRAEREQFHRDLLNPHSSAIPQRSWPRPRTH